MYDDVFVFIIEQKQLVFFLYLTKKNEKKNFTIIAKIKVPRLLFFMRCQLVGFRKLSFM